MIEEIIIGEKIIGDGYPIFLIAEVAQAHDGSLGLAHAYIDAAADAGADAVKFQTHIADQESTVDEPFRIKFSKQDASRYEYWKRMEFTAEQWVGLAEHAKEKNLIFLSSPFSVAAVQLLDKLDVPAWKVGSGEFRSEELLSSMIKTGKPVLYSTGMSKWDEIDSVVNFFKMQSHPLVLFQCTSMYPTSSESIGINVMNEFRTKYNCPVGLSDHSGDIFSSLLAAANGANIIEAHITFDKRMFGPDVPASLTVDQFKFLAEACKEFHKMTSNPVDKDRIADQLSQVRDLFMKSIAPAYPLEKGTILTEQMLLAKKPGTGIPFSNKNMIIGKRLIKSVNPDKLIRWDDIEGGKNA
jgi:N,N'-diacetyllegionaminate synthase